MIENKENEPNPPLRRSLDSLQNPNFKPHNIVYSSSPPPLRTISDLSPQNELWKEYIVNSESNKKRKNSLSRSDSMMDVSAYFDHESDKKRKLPTGYSKTREVNQVARQRLLQSAPEIYDHSNKDLDDIQEKSLTFNILTTYKPETILVPEFDYNTAEKVIGYRPASKNEEFKLEWRIEEGVLIVDVLYFAGSGYTSLQGLIKKFIEEEFLELLTKKPELKGCLEGGVAVVGKGIAGRLSAIFTDEVLKNNPQFSVNYKSKGTTIFANQIEDLASDYAGGLVSVTALKDNEKSRNAAIETYNFWEAIKKGDSKISNVSKDVVEEIVAYFEEGTDQGMQYYVEAGIMPPPKIVDVEINGIIHENVRKYPYARFVDVDAMMRGCDAELTARGIKSPQKPEELITIKDLSELKDKNFRIIFNCTGLGRLDPNKELSKDEVFFNKESSPIAGHLIYGKCEHPFTNSEDKKYVYIAQPTIANSKTKEEYSPRLQLMPKLRRDKDNNIITNCVKGGTFQQINAFDPNKDCHTEMADRHEYYFGSEQTRKLEKFKDWKVLSPIRRKNSYTTNLELERTKANSKTIKL